MGERLTASNYKLRERDAKKSAWKAAIDWLVRGVLAAVLIGIAVKMGLGEMLG